MTQHTEMARPNRGERPTWERRRRPVEWATREAELTARMLALNLSVTLLPPLLFTLAACVHVGAPGLTVVGRLIECLALFACYGYIFDSSNQAHAGPEDQVNKRHRPIPRGLATPAGLMRRFWCSMAVYPVLGMLTGTLVWVVAWQVLTVVLNLVSRPPWLASRKDLVTKPVVMVLGTIAQLAAAWQLVAPIDGVGWTWILTISIAFNLPLRFEDVRDVDGDRRVGRTTWPMVVGHWPVRWWFAITIAGVPIALHALLYLPSPAPWPIIALCDAALAALCWLAAIRGLLLRSVRADRSTYLMYTYAYCLALISGGVMLG